MLAIRISRPYGDLSSFIERLDSRCDKIAIYEHVESSRPHIHGLLVNCQVSTDTLKNYIKSSLGVTSFPKTDWSFITQWDGKPVNVKFITYMSKGKLEPKYLKGFTSEEVDSLKAQWEERAPRAKVQTRLMYVVKETPNERKLRQSEMVDEVIKRYKTEKMSSDDPDAFILQTIYRVVVVENNNMLSRYKMRDYYDTIQMKLNTTTFLKQMKDFVAFKV